MITTITYKNLPLYYPHILFSYSEFTFLIWSLNYWKILKIFLKVHFSIRVKDILHTTSTLLCFAYILAIFQWDVCFHMIHISVSFLSLLGGWGPGCGMEALAGVQALRQALGSSIRCHLYWERLWESSAMKAVTSTVVLMPHHHWGTLLVSSTPFPPRGEVILKGVPLGAKLWWSGGWGDTGKMLPTPSKQPSSMFLLPRVLPAS